MKALNDEEDFSIPMTPMIDVVFQLLIFFLLATTVQEEELDLTINLPSGSQGAKRGDAGGTRLVVSVRKDGSVSLGGMAVEWPELRKRLADAGRAKDKPQVFVGGDEEAPNGKVARVFQFCAEAGLRSINYRYLQEGIPAKP